MTTNQGPVSLLPSDSADIVHVPTPEVAASLLDQIGWAHRWNSLIKAREWRLNNGTWERGTPRLEARIRADLRERTTGAPPEAGKTTHRMVAMQSIWGEVLATLDAHPDQQYHPVRYATELSGNDEEADEFTAQLLNSELTPEILPWFDLFQRRANESADTIYHPDIIIKTGTRLMPSGMEQYTADLFHVIPLALAGNRRTNRIKYHGRDSKVLIYTTPDENLAQKLADPELGLFLGSYWANREPWHIFPEVEEKEVKKERAISEWAATMAERIVSECKSGKSINEYLVALEHFGDLDEALAKTRAGVEKSQSDQIAHCLREWYGWENRIQGKTRTSKWFAPDHKDDE